MGDDAAAEMPELPVGRLDDDALPTILEKFHAVYGGAPGITTNIAKMKSREERDSMAPPPPADDAEGEAKEAAEKARAEFEVKTKSLMYAELGIVELHSLLNAVKSQDMPLYANKGYFVDIGSGVGKACVAAQLLHPFEKVVGIETLQSLNDLANQAMDKQKELEQKGAEDAALPELQYIKGDLVNPPADEKGQVTCNPELDGIVSQVAVCLAFSTSFGEDQIAAMTDFALKMPDGSYFIAVGQGLPDSATFGENRHPLQRRSVAIKKLLAKSGTDPAATEIPTKESFEKAIPIGLVEVACKEVKVAWGTSKVYIYKKIPGPFSKGNHWGLAKWTDSDGPWEQLVGLKKEDAEERLKATWNEDRKVNIVMLDPNEDGEIKEPEVAVEDGRILIRYDPKTGLVTQAPFYEREEEPAAA